MNTHIAYIGLGSNLGEPDRNLKSALDAMQDHGLILADVSRVYSTEPQGGTDSPWFANQVARIECPDDMTAEILLDLLLGIESMMGRIRSSDPEQRYAPRIIDLDLLLFDNKTVETEHLTLPHPLMTRRAFVLVPLKDIAPNIILPSPINRSVADVLDELNYTMQGNKIFQ